MKVVLKLAALALLTTASAVHALGNVHGGFFVRYDVDLGAKSGTGSPLHPTFTTPYFGTTVPYETLTIAADVGATGTCWKVSAIRFGTTGAEQKMWIESTPGTWVSLADDVVNTLDPSAYIYTESTTPKVIRIADFTSYAPGSQGTFSVTLNSLYYPSESRLESCDRFASMNGYPYVRISASGVVSFVRRQGAP
jgi:hypothetical protein